MIVDIYASGTDCVIESKEYTGKAFDGRRPPCRVRAEDEKGSAAHL